MFKISIGVSFQKGFQLTVSWSGPVPTCSHPEFLSLVSTLSSYSGTAPLYNTSGTPNLQHPQQNPQSENTVISPTMTDTTLPTSNKAVVWVGARKLEIQERPVLPPGDNEVLVEIVSTGICGSDCHNWESDKVSRQLVLGHESSGVVIKIGKDVRDRFVGQRVAVEPGFACME